MTTRHCRHAKRNRVFSDYENNVAFECCDQCYHRLLHAWKKRMDQRTAEAEVPIEDYQ